MKLQKHQHSSQKPTMRALGPTRKSHKKVPYAVAGDTVSTAMRLHLAAKPQPQHDCTCAHHTWHVQLYVYIYIYIYMYAYLHTNVYLNTWVSCESACTEISRDTHDQAYTIKQNHQSAMTTISRMMDQSDTIRSKLHMYIHACEHT